MPCKYIYEDIIKKTNLKFRISAVIVSSNKFTKSRRLNINPQFQHTINFVVTNKNENGKNCSQTNVKNKKKLCCVAHNLALSYTIRPSRINLFYVDICL